MDGNAIAIQFDIKWYCDVEIKFCANGGAVIYWIQVLIQRGYDYSCTYAMVGIENLITKERYRII